LSNKFKVLICWILLNKANWLPYLNDGASVILIRSTAAHCASSGMTNYAAAKAAAGQDLYDNLGGKINYLVGGHIAVPAAITGMIGYSGAVDQCVPEKRLRHSV